jgi:hypothetical protein
MWPHKPHHYIKVGIPSGGPSHNNDYKFSSPYLSHGTDYRFSSPFPSHDTDYKFSSPYPCHDTDQFSSLYPSHDTDYKFSSPYPSHDTDCKFCWSSKEIKWAEHRLGLMSCNWALYCNSRIFWCYFCSKPSSPTLNMFGAVFIETFAAVYQSMLYHISEYHIVLELFLHLLHVSLTWCWTPYTLWSVWVTYVYLVPCSKHLLSRL